MFIMKNEAKALSHAFSADSEGLLSTTVPSVGRVQQGPQFRGPEVGTTMSLHHRLGSLTREQPSSRTEEPAHLSAWEEFWLHPSRRSQSGAGAICN